MVEASDAFKTRVAEICTPLPGAEFSDNWGQGHLAWRLGDKMFALFGQTYPGVSVKTPDIESATLLIEAGVGIKAPYFHRSWILLPEEIDDGELRHRLNTSYDIIRASLPKKTTRDLAPRKA